MYRRRVLVLAALAFVATPLVAASAAEDPARPGLPEYPPEGGTWSGTRTASLTEAARAKQWLRLPPLRLGVYVHPQATPPRDPSCRRHPPYESLREFTADAYIASPQGKQHPWGEAPTFSVRSLAFGSVPVEIELALSQVRADGLPRPWVLDAPTRRFCVGRGPHAGPAENEAHSPPATLAGKAVLTVQGVRVDGVALDLDGGCRSAEPLDIALRGRDYYDLDPDLRPGEHTRGVDADWDLNTTRFHSANQGGLLEGTVDIPPFIGCTTPDDNLDALLTGLISADDNPISVRQGSLDDYCYPGARDEAQCRDPRAIDLPRKAG